MQSLNLDKYQQYSSRTHYSRSFCPNSTSETALSPIRKTKQKNKRTHRSLKKQGTATARAMTTPPEVTFRYDVKVAKIPERKDWGSFMTQIFGRETSSKIKDLAVVEHMPAQQNVPKNEYHTTINAGQTAFI